jgi:hypothetical protein
MADGEEEEDDDYDDEGAGDAMTNFNFEVFFRTSNTMNTLLKSKLPRTTSESFYR